MLSEKETERYSRHLLLKEVGAAGQEKLKAARVAVIGAGGLGCPVLQYLAAAGVGTIGLFDPDKVDVSNLQRQVLFDEGDAGRSKVKVAAEKLKAQNPQIKIDPFEIRLDSSNALQLLAPYDVIVDGSDNFPTRYLANDAAVMLGKPLVFGSIFRFEAQVSVFNYRNGPTYRCLYPDPPFPGEVPGCSEAGVIGFLPGITGSMMAGEAIKVITGAGEVLSGKLLRFDTLTMDFTTFSFRKNDQIVVNELIDYALFCHEDIKEVDVAEFNRRSNANEAFQLVDVREPDEYAKKNIGGIPIPLGTLKESLSKLKKDVPVIVHCAGGTRSKKAARLLIDEGFSEVLSLKNGLKDL